MSGITAPGDDNVRIREFCRPAEAKGTLGSGSPVHPLFTSTLRLRDSVVGTRRLRFQAPPDARGRGVRGVDAGRLRVEAGLWPGFSHERPPGQALSTKPRVLGDRGGVRRVAGFRAPLHGLRRGFVVAQAASRRRLAGPDAGSSVDQRGARAGVGKPGTSGVRSVHDDLDGSRTLVLGLRRLLLLPGTARHAVADLPASARFAGLPQADGRRARGRGRVVGRKTWCI